MAGELRPGASAAIPVAAAIPPVPTPAPDMNATIAAGATLITALAAGLNAMATLQAALGVINTKLDSIIRVQVKQAALVEGLLDGIIAAETARMNDTMAALAQLSTDVAAIPGAQAQIDAAVAAVADNIAAMKAAIASPTT